MAPTDKQLNQLYWQGHEALQKGDWAGALKRFTDLEAATAREGAAERRRRSLLGAYTLLQAKRTTEAKTTVERLHRDFPEEPLEQGRGRPAAPGATGQRRGEGRERVRRR
jgi:outer membrane protein assembly factor BamD (BamD/ComL family)